MNAREVLELLASGGSVKCEIRVLVVGAVAPAPNLHDVLTAQGDGVFVAYLDNNRILQSVVFEVVAR